MTAPGGPDHVVLLDDGMIILFNLYALNYGASLVVLELLVKKYINI